MGGNTLRVLYKSALLSASALAFGSTAMAQDAGTGATAAATVAQAGSDAGGTGDIVVTARRREESLQDVPLTVQAVTSNELNKLNLKEFKDIQTIVPGLTLGQDANGIGTQATLRGVNYDVNASGNNGTIEFYMNDAPISAAILFQSLFDVGQIEVLRGPQGTLRGRASPSGSITVTTHKPDLSEAGGSLVGTVNTWGDTNGQAAINIPLVTDKLAIRLAGVIDETDNNRIKSINSDGDPYRRTQGGRLSARFQPFDNLTFDGSFTRTVRTASNYVQVESANIANPALIASPIEITAADRDSVQRAASTYRQSFTVWDWAAQWNFLGQSLNYVGSHNKQHYQASTQNDVGAALPGTAPDAFLSAAQVTDLPGTQTNHEIRLSSQQRVFGIFDYVGGVMFNNTVNPTSLDVQTPLFFAPALTPYTVFHTAVAVLQKTEERSFFGNLTAHIGDLTEISGGVRRIRYHETGGLSLSGVAVPAANDDRTLHATIFSASLKHNFTRSLMAYFNFGTSWRPGSSSNSIQLRNQSEPYGTLAELYYPDAEKSKSYEIGIKSAWFDNRLRANITAYHQTFDNFAYAAPNVYYISNIGGVTGVSSITTFTIGVPARVSGVEGEISGNPLKNWSIDASASYSKGTITNALIPCNPYAGVPTAAQIFTATNGQQVATCQVNHLRAGTAAPFVATVQSEYDLPIAPTWDGYLRGLLTYYGKSLADPTNPYDDVKAYALVNLYAGARSANGAWEIGMYVKNLFDVDRVLSRGLNPAISGASVIGGSPPISTYRVITTNPTREVGVTARFAFGSR